MRHTRNRIVSIVTALTMVVTCFCGFGSAGVFAAEEKELVALSVYDGDTLVKEYTLDDLKNIAAKEGNKKYKYSGYNRNPSFYTFGDPDNQTTPSKKDVQECIGPTAEGILADAGVSYTDNQTITFKGSDGYGTSFVAGDIFGARYYYPNAAGIKKGDAAPESAYADAQITPVIIDLYDDNPANDYIETVLRFGQKTPNERNNTFFAKYVANGGKIIVGDETTEQWEAVHTPIYKSGTVLPETAIEFDTKYISNKYAAGTVYYTVAYSQDKNGAAPEGEEPKAGDQIYNYDKYEGTNPPILEDEGIYTIKVKVIGYGLLDSETTTFTYRVEDVDSPVKPKTFTAVRSNYNSIKLSWTKSNEADGYEILRADAKNTKQETIATVTDATYTDTNLVTGLEYTYTVRAYKQLDSGQKIYASGVTAKGKTYLTKPTLSSAARYSYNGIKIKWNKISGATGYQIYRYDAVTKKYSLVKTITSGGTTSYTNTGLTTGRKYTYKVRAYRTLEDGTASYSSYSSTKAATPYLTKPTVKLAAGKKSVTVKWNKISGATGYKIYRSTKKNSGYKVVKTIKKGSTVSWKNTKLKKGKRYYYKVKAYRAVNKKNVYSSYSSLKYVKAK